MKRYKKWKHASEVNTRKERKALWIRTSNEVHNNRECSNGVYLCYHVYEEEHPWQWVDFRFLSQLHHRRYFSVASQTLVYKAYCLAEDEAYNYAEKDWPEPQGGVYFGPAEQDPTFGKVYELRTTEEYREMYNHRRTAIAEYLKHLVQKPVVVRPTIEVRLEYGPVAVGVWAALNKPHLDHNAMMEFIQQFRDLGEPLKQGIVWQGEEVTVVPAEIYKGD